MWLASEMMKGNMVFLNDMNTILSIVHVKDCAALHVAALENPNAKGRFLCSTGAKNQSDLFELLIELNPEVKNKLEESLW